MRIFFRTRKLQKICSESKESIKHLGAKRGLKLQQRMSELKAADSLVDISQLPPARCHEVTNNRKGQLSVDLEHPYRLIFIPANEPIPLRDGSLAREEVTEIEIIEVTDTHNE